MYKYNEHVLSILHELKDVLQVLYIDDIVDGKPILDKAISLITKLDAISKTTQLCLQILVKDVEKNRYRVDEVLRSIDSSSNSSSKS